MSWPLTLPVSGSVGRAARASSAAGLAIACRLNQAGSTMSLPAPITASTALRRHPSLPHPASARDPERRAYAGTRPRGRSWELRIGVVDIVTPRWWPEATGASERYERSDGGTASGRAIAARCLRAPSTRPSDGQAVHRGERVEAPTNGHDRRGRALVGSEAAANRMAICRQRQGQAVALHVCAAPLTRCGRPCWG